jgi:ligand-binding sensor domain-containing protein
MNRNCIFLLIFLSSQFLFGKTIKTYLLNDAVPPKSGLAGNGITDIKSTDNVLWFGTGHGLSRTTDIGNTFASFGTSHGMTRGSISALWVSGDTIIVATAWDTLTDVADDYLDMGTGLSFSTDAGNTWRAKSQPGPTPIQNITYDIAVHNNTMWITNFGGGVQKSDDWGNTWVEVAPDTFLFDPGKRLNHRGFSTISANNELWIGTAGGINKSADGGTTWTNFNATNQENPISGNFVVALGFQPLKNKNIIWAATWKAEGESEVYAVSKTENGGLSWDIMLQEEKAHNFAFDGSIVYVATDNGLYKSVDSGETWYLFPRMDDTVSGDKVFTNEVYSAHGEKGDLWIGTADGLAYTKDNGYSWDITRAFVATGVGDTPRTYAYPNPFSPLRHNQLGEDGFVRFQYNTKSPTAVTIKIFDFAMDLVTTVVENKSMPGPGDFSEVWNGKNDYGDAVANGVYFYSVDMDDDGTHWGKIMIVN